MRTFVAATVAVATAALALPALAAPPTGYATFGYTHLDSDNASLGQVDGRMGLRLGRHVGVEGELGTGVKGDDVTVGGVKTEIKAQPNAAAYAVGFLPVSDNLELLARVGYGAQRTRIETGNVGRTETDHSVNYGVGAQYFFNGGANGVRADYTRRDVSDERGDDTNAYSVAYVHRF